jgi:hypothetical protein
MRMPTCLVIALLTMQPRLEAEESLLAANRIAVGGGKMKSADSGRLLREWAGAAHPEAPNPKPDAGVLQAAGFAVRRVKRVKKG